MKEWVLIGVLVVACAVIGGGLMESRAIAARKLEEDDRAEHPRHVEDASARSSGGGRASDGASTRRHRHRHDRGALQASEETLMRADYQQVFDGRRVTVRRRWHKLTCCDCGLTHVLRFRISKGVLSFQAWRDGRATGGHRVHGVMMSRRAGKRR